MKTTIITARHTEYDEGYVFSLSVHRGGVPVVQNFATRCPTDLLGGVPLVQNFATRCPTDLLGGGSQIIFFSRIFFPVPLPMGWAGGSQLFFFSRIFF